MCYLNNIFIYNMRRLSSFSAVQTQIVTHTHACTACMGHSIVLYFSSYKLMGTRASLMTRSPPPSSPGVVDPYSELDCEVVWHPSFSAPTEGDFDLCVHKGNVQRLHCVAKVYLPALEMIVWSCFAI